MTEEQLRIRVRPLKRATLEEAGTIWSHRQVLSMPGMGEAIDFASDPYRMRRTGVGVARALHWGHAVGQRCSDAAPEDAGRCLIVDYVAAATDQSEDELEVAGLVAQGRAG